MYNTRLKERYEDDLSTHPDLDLDLLLKVGSFGGPDRNWVYSPSTLQPRTCECLAMFQPLDAYNQL
jgi:hypothetical protein